MKNRWLILVGMVALLLMVVASSCSSPAPAPAPAPSTSASPAASKPAASPAASPTAAAAPAFRLKFSTWMPAGANHPDYEMALWFTKTITERTNGRVAFDMFPSEQLGAQKDQVDGIKSGLFDIGHYQSSLTPAKTPLGTIDWQPLAYTDDCTAVLKSKREINKLPALKDELTKWNAMYVLGCAGGPRIVMSKKPVNKLEDFKGLRIRTSGREADALKILGANPVSIATPDVYDALSKGTIDATTQPYVNLVSYGIPEVAKYAIFTNLSMGSPTLIMSISTFNKLPADVQGIILKTAEEEDTYGGNYITQRIKTEIDKGRQAGKQTFIDFTTAEQQRYIDIAGLPVMKDWVKEMDGLGLPGQAVLEAWVKAQQQFMPKK
jgi:TRAP-type C4-dicarboxylate transport system substrate-binding protein